MIKLLNKEGCQNGNGMASKAIGFKARVGSNPTPSANFYSEPKIERQIKSLILIYFSYFLKNSRKIKLKSKILLLQFPLLGDHYPRI